MNRKISHKIRIAHRYLGLFLGLITEMSGFSLWFVSPPTIRKFLN